jgi:glycosyltransferase involved in cell wall biosynthesis
MRVLRVIADMNPSSGGPCQGIRNTVPELEKHGIYNEVVSLDKPNAAYLGGDSFSIHALGPAKGPWSYSPKLMPWLMKNLVRFDMVIVHGLWLYPSYAALKAIRLYRQQHGRVPKFYVMPHGMLDPYFQQAPERRLKAIRNQLYWKIIEEKVVNEADGLLFTCEAELLLAREPFRPYQPKRELNIGYGIAQPPRFSASMLEAFYQKCQGLQGQSYLLFLSRIHEKKGVDVLIKAYASLCLNLQEQQTAVPKLVIAGPGIDSAYGKKMQRLAGMFPQLCSSVFFPGMLSGAAKWGAFYGCEAFVLPSHQENFGIAVVEALACAKPVLISRQVNIWREIEAEGGGMVAPDSEEGTKQMLQAWLGKPLEEKKQIGRAARISYEKRFSIGPAVMQLVEMIKH